MNNNAFTAPRGGVRGRHENSIEMGANLFARAGGVVQGGGCVASPGPVPVNKTIRGRVVDAGGRPLAGVDVGSHWISQGKQGLRPVAVVAKTDAQGEFKVELAFYYGRSQAWLALDAGCKHGAIATVGPESTDEPLVFTMSPLVHVHGKYTCKELGTLVGWTNTMMMAMPANVRIEESMYDALNFSILLPAGKYKLQEYGGQDVKGIGRDLTLITDKLDVDLGEVDLAAAPLAKLKGKEPPALQVTGARGASKDVKLSDYKGKWVALEFWGFW